jgi:hypothetical protein
MKKLSFFLVATALLFSSCGKDKTKTELLTGSWKITNVVKKDGTNGQLSACSKDDVITFLANGSTTIDEGPTKCSPSDPQTINKTWRWSNNETELILDVNDTLKSVSLTSTTLVGSYNSSSGAEVVTFTKL